MKITLDIPDGMGCSFLNGVVETRSGLTMVTYALDSDDLPMGQKSNCHWRNGSNEQ